MNDLVILGIVLGGIVLVIFVIQEREAGKRALELKMFQMENTRVLLENAKFMQQMETDAKRNQAENRQFFRGLSHSVGQIYLKLDEEQNGKT